MKAFIRLFPVVIVVFAGVAILATSASSCTKTETIIVQPDSVKIVRNLLVGKWNVQTAERALYSGNTVTGNDMLYFNGTNTFTEYKTDLSYSSTYKGAPAGSGTWEILSPYYLVMDKGNESQERYYYIMALDKRILITHGPFKKDGTRFLPSEVDYFYYSK